MKLWQRLTQRWTHLVFDTPRTFQEATTPYVRALRAVEEVLELAQSLCITEDEIDTIKRQVYDKPPGVPCRELGGVLVTLCGVAESLHLDLEECFWAEFEVIMHPDKIAKVRHRNLHGDKIGMRDADA